MRRIFSTVTVAAVLGAFSVGNALAADLIVNAPVSPVIDDTSSSIYFKIYGGPSAPNTLEWQSLDYDLDAGWFVGGSVGLVVLPGLSFELDVNASRAEYTGYGTYLDSVGIFANAVYEVALTDAFSAYVGAGVGALRVTYDNGTKYAGTGAAGQVFAGLSLDVTENVTAFGEARYQTAFGAIHSSGPTFDYSRAALLGGLKFGF